MAKKKDYKGLMESIMENTAMGFGGGVVVQTLFSIASGQTISGYMDILGGTFVLLFSALGFGLGWARGHEEVVPNE